MAKAKILTTDEEIDELLKDALTAPPLPSAEKVEFLPGVRILLVFLKSGQRLAIPVEDLEELHRATDEQLSRIELEGAGVGIHFPAFDGNLYVPYLTAGSRGSSKWMEYLRTRDAGTLVAA